MIFGDKSIDGGITMPVVSAGPTQVRPANNAVAMYQAAKELAALVDQQFAAVRFVGVGIAGGSCCAAVAVVPAPNWPAAVSALGNGALPFAVVYGNSQLLAGGLALGVAGGHAERAALTAANAAGLTLWTNANNAVLYVELPPCAPPPINVPNCNAWLGLGGAVPAHPYAGAFMGVVVTLNVWYGHANVAAMTAHHGLPLGPGGAVPNQINTVAGW